MSKEMLTPVSFHLRNFNNYTSLDISASQNGNLTLIGENAAGKTTLANCFFPMLIDGSIATPSFNPAKGTDKLDKTTIRNSKNDTRTFEGMLLGWGRGSMKVRTGYSYMLMKSNKRQVIVGIGAHRAVGETRKPTWWFVMSSTNINEEMPLVTVDNKGQSLEREEFVQANEDWGINFRVFSQVSEFQNYVSDKIYGFNDLRSLHQLAATYRLLASPILTAGNARLTPILEAMKNAQEGIDNQVIDFVADTQREVNRKKAILERLSRAQKRLYRLKREIFWRNLNRLKELTLDPYGNNYQKLNNQRSIKERLQHRLSDYIHQLELLKPQLEQAEKQFQLLQQRQAEQKNIENQRKDKQDLVDNLLSKITSYKLTKQKFKQQKSSLLEAQKKFDELNNSKLDLNSEILPLEKDLTDLATNLGQLTNIVDQSDLSSKLTDLKHYLRKIKNLQKDYDNILNNQKHLTEDVQIVSEIRENMDGKIDLRTNGPVVGRIREGLHQDNLDVHNAGAAKMNIRHAELEQKRLDLLETNPDLQEFLNHEALWSKIKNIADKLQQLNDDLKDVDNKIERQTSNISNIEKEISETKEILELNYKGFDLDDQNDKINKLRQEIAKLVIDPDLNVKVAQAKETLNQYQKSQEDLGINKTKVETDIKNINNIIKELTQTLNDLTTQTEANLKILNPYMIEGFKIETVSEAMNFLNQHRSEIRNNSFGDLSDKIGRLIHTNNENGIDPYALDTIFEDRGHNKIASAMRRERSVDQGDLRVVPFDINQAQDLIAKDKDAVERSLEQLNSGNEVAQMTYLEAAVHQISDQYDLIDGYNEMLARGVHSSQGIQLKVSLVPKDIDEQVIEEARNTHLTQRPALLKEVQNRLERLANDGKVADDDELFTEEAHQLLDIRQWSDFQIWIHRKQAETGEFELVDDKFVQSGGSGAEKAQAMVLPLLLVPKMVLHRSNRTDTPHMVMFDEFADKLDPETAKSFARTIDHFGFNFIATMPSGAQNKILADGVENIAYDVIAPAKKDDGKFHKNIVRPAMTWTKA